MITLEDMKRYLNVDDDYDDKLINELMEVAEIYINSCVGVYYKNSELGLKLSAILIKKLVADMYENRGTTITSTNIPRPDRISMTILDSLANFTE